MTCILQVWTILNTPYSTINAKCGNSVVFTSNGFHDLQKVATASCTGTPVGSMLAGAGSFVVPVAVGSVAASHTIASPQLQSLF